MAAQSENEANVESDPNCSPSEAEKARLPVPSPAQELITEDPGAATAVGRVVLETAATKEPEDTDACTAKEITADEKELAPLAVKGKLIMNKDYDEYELLKARAEQRAQEKAADEEEEAAAVAEAKAAAAAAAESEEAAASSDTVDAKSVEAESAALKDQRTETLEPKNSPPTDDEQLKPSDAAIGDSLQSHPSRDEGTAATSRHENSAFDSTTNRLQEVRDRWNRRKAEREREEEYQNRLNRKIEAANNLIRSRRPTWEVEPGNFSGRRDLAGPDEEAKDRLLRERLINRFNRGGQTRQKAATYNDLPTEGHNVYARPTTPPPRERRDNRNNVAYKVVNRRIDADTSSDEAGFDSDEDGPDVHNQTRKATDRQRALRDRMKRRFATNGNSQDGFPASSLRQDSQSSQRPGLIYRSRSKQRSLSRHRSRSRHRTRSRHRSQSRQPSLESDDTFDEQQDSIFSDVGGESDTQHQSQPRRMPPKITSDERYYSDEYAGLSDEEDEVDYTTGSSYTEDHLPVRRNPKHPAQFPLMDDWKSAPGLGIQSPKHSPRLPIGHGRIGGMNGQGPTNIPPAQTRPPWSNTSPYYMSAPLQANSPYYLSTEQELPSTKLKHRSDPPISLSGETARAESPDSGSIPGDGIPDDKSGEPTFNKVERAGLSISIQLKRHEKGSGTPESKIIHNPISAEALAWKNQKSDLAEIRSTSNLLTIRALEYTGDGSSLGKMTLVCPGGPTKESESASVQLRWLHLQRNALNFQILHRLVLSCPYISKELTAVAVTLLDEVESRFGKSSESGAYVEPGTVLRCVGKYLGQVGQNETQGAEQAYFLSAPHLNLQNRAVKVDSREGYAARTLLQSLYGYDIDDGNTKQVVQKMMGGRSKEVLHVNQMWCLLIGSDILVTMSSMTAKVIQGPSIAVDERSFNDGGLLSICLYDEASRRYNSVVDLDYTFADLLRHCVSLVSGNVGDTLEYELLTTHDEVLTPARWLAIVSFPTTNLLTFYLRDKSVISYGQNVDTRSNHTIQYQNIQYQRGINRDIQREYYPHESHTRPGSRHSYAEPAYNPYPGPSGKHRQTQYPPPVQAMPTYHQTDTDHLSSVSKFANDELAEPSLSGESSQQDAPGTSVTELDWAVVPYTGKALSREEEIYIRRLHKSNMSRDMGTQRYQSNVGRNQRFQRHETRSSHGYDKALVLYGRESGRTNPLLKSRSNPQLYHPPSSRPSHHPGVGDRGNLHWNWGGQNPQGALTRYPPPNDRDPDSYSLGGRSTRSEFTRSMRGLPYGYDPQGMSSQLQGPQLYGFPHFQDQRLRWRDRVAMTQNVMNESAPQIVAHTGIYSIDNATDTDDQMTDLDSGVLNNDETGSVDLAETSRAKKEKPGGFNTDQLDANIATSSRTDPKKTPGDAFSTPQPSSDESNHSKKPHLTKFSKRMKTVQFTDALDKMHGTRRPNAPQNPGRRTAEPGYQQPNAQMPAEELPNIVSIPFLEWPLNSEIDQRDTVTIEKNVIKILSSINKNLQNGHISKIYERSFRCTLQELEQRHSLLFQDADEEDKPKDPLPSCEGDATSQDTNASISVARDSPQSLTGLQEEGDTSTEGRAKYMQNSTTNHEAGPRKPKSQDAASMKKLHEISQEILSLFIPKEGSPLSHHICVRFWGAVDTVYRQLAWEAAFFDQEQFVIRNYDVRAAMEKRPKAQRTHSWTKCDECRNGATYSSALEALKHLHSHRICPFENSHYKPTQPWDDPCYVWIRSVTNYTPQVSRRPTVILQRLDSFILKLSSLKEQVSHLQSLVANAWSIRVGDRKKPTRPPLPVSLVAAFTQIMMLFVLEAQDLSLQNRISNAMRKHIPEPHIQWFLTKQTELELRQNTVYMTARDLLQDAKKDIILLGSTSRNVNSLGVEAVGAEFLIMFLISNMQNGKVMPKSLVASANNGSADYIHVYRSYIATLRFQASKRPQRRLFLDINALQEELAAVHAVDSSHSQLLDNYLQLLSPASFRVTNKTRVGVFQTEKALARKQQQKIRIRIQDIYDLADKAGYLRDQVKQMIEIVEEDHGKAIRVFTIVTLFFLPLSFMSSFMGMNTTDIRDMEYSQSIFWSTSIPVTAVVLIAALIYGYYGDEIRDWLTEKMRSNRSPLFPHRQRMSAVGLPLSGPRRSLISRKTADSLGF